MSGKLGLVSQTTSKVGLLTPTLLLGGVESKEVSDLLTFAGRVRGRAKSRPQGCLL